MSDPTSILDPADGFMALSASIQRWTGSVLQGPAMMVESDMVPPIGSLYLLLPWIKETLQDQLHQRGNPRRGLSPGFLSVNFASGALTDITGKRVLIQSGSLTRHWHSGEPPGLRSSSGTDDRDHRRYQQRLAPGCDFFERYPDNRGYALAVHALGQRWRFDCPDGRSRIGNALLAGHRPGPTVLYLSAGSGPS